MDKLKTDDLGGLPLTLDDLRWMLGRITAPTQGIYVVLNNMLAGYGSNFIVQGCVLGGSTGAYTLTEGWIMLAGELIKVDAQSAFNEGTDSTFVKATTYDTRGNKTFRNATTNDVYEKNRASISGSGGTLVYNGNTFFQLSNQAVFGATIVTLTKKVIEIGTWDMSTATGTATTTVSHGLSDVTKIRRVDVIITNDAGTGISPLGSYSNSLTGVNGGVESAGSGSFSLRRETSSLFDGTSYNGAANRGWVTIEYEN